MAASSDIVHVIQLAVAPVFLLSGVGIVLTVLTNRLARIIDRARLMEDRLRAGTTQEVRGELRARLGMLSRRARFVHLAVTLTTLCALLVCVVIAVLFIGSVLGIDVAALVALLFVAAMLAFIGALVTFLREIFLATASLRIGEGEFAEAGGGEAAGKRRPDA